ncbi:MAG: CDP-diacylglycerol--serine O-phosphatidyltransferase [Chitinophagales bacterium]
MMNFDLAKLQNSLSNFLAEESIFNLILYLVKGFKRTYIPNLLTLTNLFLGCLAIVAAFDGRLIAVPFLLLAAGFADFFDGFAARLLKVTSTIGKELDSLADMVSFGVVPGIVIYKMLELTYMETKGIDEVELFYLAPAFLVSICAAIRLAKFNVDERQTEKFLGLATPVATGAIASLIWVLNDTQYATTFEPFILNLYFLYTLTLLISYLMVSEIPMFSFKFKKRGFKANLLQIVCLIFSFSSVFIFGWAGAALIAPVYLFLVLVDNVYWSKRVEAIQL